MSGYVPVITQGNTACIETPFDIKAESLFQNAEISIGIPSGTSIDSYVLTDKNGSNITSNIVGLSIEVPNLPKGDNKLYICVLVDDSDDLCASNRVVTIDVWAPGDNNLSNNFGARYLRGILCCDFISCLPDLGIEGDKNYVHNQAIPASVWMVTHNLDKFSSVTVVDSAGTEVEGMITHINTNQATLTFSAAFSGKAYFN